MNDEEKRILTEEILRAEAALKDERANRDYTRVNAPDPQYLQGRIDGMYWVLAHLEFYAEGAATNHKEGMQP